MYLMIDNYDSFVYNLKAYLQELAAVKALDAARQENPERAAVMAKVLFAQAQLVAGITPDDPAEYGELVCRLF